MVNWRKKEGQRRAEQLLIMLQGNVGGFFCERPVIIRRSF